MKKIYNKKEEGIASTVGTIFALMIFTALLGMFMTQVVPVTMKENEAQHDVNVLSQFAQLRSTVDLLSLTRNTNYTAYVPIKLGADGVPFFASPTYGELALYPSQQNSNYQMDLHFIDVFGDDIYQNATGSLQFIAPNKYYVPEMFEFANGGLMRYNFQTNTSVFPITPNIKFEQLSLGYALDFSTNGILKVPNSNTLDINGPITVEAWIHLNSIKQQVFVDKGGEYVLWMESNGAIRFADTHGNYVDTAPLSKAFLNKWIFVVGVFSGTPNVDKASPSTAQVYINGKPAGVKWSNTTWVASTTTSPLYIGSGGSSNHVDGMMDEVRILNVPLNSTEVLHDYWGNLNAQEPGHMLPPVIPKSEVAAWYHFDTGSGTKVVDSSGNGNNGTLSKSGMWVPLTGINVDATLQNIFGNPDTVTGTETRSIAVSLEGVSSVTYFIKGTLNITVQDTYQYSQSFSLNFTKYWVNYITDALNSTGLKEGVDYTVTGNVIHIAYVENANINMVYLNMNIER